MEQIQETKKTENELAKKIATFVHISPFSMKDDGRPFCSCSFGKRKICMRPTAKVKEDEPGVAYPDFSDQVDVQKIVDSYKDQTGLEYALRQINSGRLLPSQLADKGTGSVDISEMPDNVNEAHRLALDESQKAKEVAAQLGLDSIDPAKIEKMVTDAINKKLAEQQAQQTPKAKNEGE